MARVGSAGKNRVEPMFEQDTEPEVFLPAKAKPRKRRFNPYEFEGPAKRSTKVILLFLGVTLMASGIAMVVVYQDSGLRDMLVLGSGFLFIGICFLLMDVALVAKDEYFRRKSDQQKRLHTELDVDLSRATSVQEYTLSSSDRAIVQTKTVPTVSELYGEDMERSRSVVTASAISTQTLPSTKTEEKYFVLPQFPDSAQFVAEAGGGPVTAPNTLTDSDPGSDSQAQAGSSQTQGASNKEPLSSSG